MSATVAHTSTPDLGKSAAWYAKRGWPVVPVHYPDGERCSCGNVACNRVAKHPCLPNGVHGATWWASSRPWNVGLATGFAFWVLDVDGDSGKASMAEVEKRHGRVPSTVTADTGGGGLHLLWRVPAGGTVGCRVGVLQGVDVRGSGGYIVAPPSLHASGKRYAWHRGLGPHQVAIAEAPGWLLNLAQGRGNGHGSGHGSGKRTSLGEAFRAAVPNGERNQAVAQRAGYLLRLGMDRDVATELLIGWSRTHLQPPLHDSEIRRTVGSIATREGRRVK